MTDPWLVFVRLSHGDHGAMQELLPFIEAQFGKARARGKPVNLRGIRPEDREDLLFDVAEKLWRLAPKIRESIFANNPRFQAPTPNDILEANGAITVYIQEMIGTTWIDKGRRGGREPVVLRDDPLPDEDGTWRDPVANLAAPTPDEPGRYDNALRVLRIALDRLRTAGRNLDVELANASFQQIVDLAGGEIDMDDLVYQELAATGEPADEVHARRARDRLYRRHRLVREYLHEQITEIEREGSEETEAIADARLALSKVLKRRVPAPRPIPTPPDVSPANDDDDEENGA